MVSSNFFCKILTLIFNRAIKGVWRKHSFDPRVFEALVYKRISSGFAQIKFATQKEQEKRQKVVAFNKLFKIFSNLKKIYFIQWKNRASQSSQLNASFEQPQITLTSQNFDSEHTTKSQQVREIH